MKRTKWIILLAMATVMMLAVGSASAAEFVGDENVYRLEAGEVVNDDLYIGANEVIIDGTVNGDLFVGAGYIEINGTVNGDLFAAAGGIKLTGNVTDDARLAGGGVEFSGVVGDDLFMAGGGSPGGISPQIQVGTGRSITQGVFVSRNAQVGGDMMVGGGAGQLAGLVGGDLMAAMGSVNFGADVAGNVELASDQISFGESAAIGGRLRVTASTESFIPPRFNERYQFNQTVQPEVETVSTAQQVGSWLWRTFLALLGFAALSWLALRFTPKAVTEPAGMLEEAPGKSAAYGLVGALFLMFVPLLSAVLVTVVWIFFGAGPGLALLVALFSVLSLLWVFSPLVTGYWLGKFTGLEPFTGMLIGVAAVVVLMRLPWIGWLMALASFLFAFGALLLLRFRSGPSVEEPVLVEKPIPAM